MSEIKDMVEDCIINMMFSNPVYAHLVTRIGYEVIDNEYAPYCAWTDGKKITVNEYGIKCINDKLDSKKIDKKQLMFIISHELGHILGLTWDRGKALGIDCKDTSDDSQIKHELWNMATDYEINSLLYNNKEGSVPKPVGEKPDWCLYDEKYKNMTAEEIYKDLLKQSEEDEEFRQQILDMCDESNQDYDGQSGNGNQIQVTVSKDENGKIKVTGIQLDKHLDVQLTELEKSDLRQKVESALSSASYSLNSSSIERLKQFILKPVKFNWRQALTKYIKSFMVGDFSWKKPARSGVYRGLILPSPDKVKKLKVAVAIDTSGSISDKQLNTFMNHLLKITSQFKSYQIDVWCFSTQVHENTLVTITEKTGNIIDKIKLQSYGGTDISSNFDFVKKHYGSEKPDVLIIFSDFYDSLDGDTETRFDYCKCVWLVVNHKEFKKPAKIKAERFDYED